MIDPPIDAILWDLLARHSYVTLEQVCWWDSSRAEAAILRAGLVRISSSSAFSTTADTAHWFEETWNAIRACRPTDPVESADDRRDDVGETDESAPAPEIPAAPPAQDHATQARFRFA